MKWSSRWSITTAPRLTIISLSLSLLICYIFLCSLFRFVGCSFWWSSFVCYTISPLNVFGHSYYLWFFLFFCFVQGNKNFDRMSCSYTDMKVDELSVFGFVEYIVQFHTIYIYIDWSSLIRATQTEKIQEVCSTSKFHDIHNAKWRNKLKENLDKL